MPKQLPQVKDTFGAPMGRYETFQAWPAPGKVRLYRVRLNSGGYDDGGAYWGIDRPLYCAEDTAGGCQFIRADSRACAALKFQKKCSIPIPWAKSPVPTLSKNTSRNPEQKFPYSV